MGTQLVDPICHMTVDLDAARAQGLVAEYDGREFGFCSAGCKRTFERDPARYAGASA